ncbi:hypothetical protein M3P05_09250 [Sansalvadorimonas sp. 2012CJ34-2]|uniref:Uncharacterized protein n=1 Tax=Parendozoicomonas callyspongiae TaxID=2942213 RepID=A0ABT0PI04_9GAMM|nr:hypothetical protein [Sansalvadorimonas sp. 2012CJ34-2]MCL6270118.1 hypothetical protein [Sansalvadorimonas sp. 2012CJ34-2]
MAINHQANDSGIVTTSSTTGIAGIIYSKAADFIGKSVKNISCHNALIDLDDSRVKDIFRTRPLLADYILMNTCSFSSSAACLITGCYLGHSSPALLGELIVGCGAGAEAGHRYYKFLKKEYDTNIADQPTTTSPVQMRSHERTNTQTRPNLHSQPPYGIQPPPPSYEEACRLTNTESHVGMTQLRRRARNNDIH